MSFEELNPRERPLSQPIVTWALAFSCVLGSYLILTNNYSLLIGCCNYLVLILLRDYSLLVLGYLIEKRSI